MSRVTSGRRTRRFIRPGACQAARQCGGARRTTQLCRWVPLRAQQGAHGRSRDANPEWAPGPVSWRCGSTVPRGARAAPRRGGHQTHQRWLSWASVVTSCRMVASSPSMVEHPRCLRSKDGGAGSLRPEARTCGGGPTRACTCSQRRLRLRGAAWWPFVSRARPRDAAEAQGVRPTEPLSALSSTEEPDLRRRARTICARSWYRL